ncbi:hypothetical protein [Haladaptatus salinisoli]|uniref:hypothetical protein n=1 Tax=Haladaptatus salinisoli TaxID=2884876 RepID=UPI001D0B1E56|nr:hypothetical protein [Haladaptatus salinisoli]
MANIVYEGPDEIQEQTVDADNVSDSGKVEGIRVKLKDEAYLHIPYARLYWI